MKATHTGDLGFEQPERQEENDKHKPGVRVPASEVRSCYLIFPSIEHVQRRRTKGPSCLRTWETGELRSPDKVIGNKGRTDLDHLPCTGVINTPISDVFSSDYVRRKSSDLQWRVRQLGVIILVDVINTGSFLPPLSSWGSPRGLKGWLYADDSLRDADFQLAARPSS